MAEQTTSQPGSPHPIPFGAAVRPEGGVDFVIFSRHAHRVWLLLFDDPDAPPVAEYEFDPSLHRLGDVWSLHVPDAREGQYYVYRMTDGAQQGAYDPDQWLLDPYALAVAGSPRWGEPFGQIPGKPPRNGPAFPKGVIVRDDFDWSGDRSPRTSMADTMIYELNVRSYTAHSTAGVEHPGSYRGLQEKIPYLADLGVTAVELLPIQEFNEMEYYLEDGTRSKLRNVWGYSTVAYFAPNGRMAHAGVYGQQVREFKELVRALHEAGIEVILDIVFNHTAEGNRNGPVYSFRGIDERIYYMVDGNGKYRDFTGCGNTVNANHPVVQELIVDCLRYWVTHMHVDGFRFDLASALTRDQHGHPMARPPVIDRISDDPVLRDAKLIAEAWDVTGLYQVGSFPGKRWSEWNGRYRDDVRSFWRGDAGKLGPLATRLTGSADLYAKEGQSPQKSINFVTSHDGYTLNDLVTYERKHNHANGEDNRDGDSHNLSANYGREGPSRDPAILAVRRRQQKNFLATLLLSQGVPMMLAGDEFSNTQKGNNNAYCQDNAVSWLNWKDRDRNQDLWTFTQQAIALRKNHPTLRRSTFLKGQTEHECTADIRWFGPNNGDPDWNHGHAVGFILSGCRECLKENEHADDLCVLINGSVHSVHFRMPDSGVPPWKLELHTHEQPPKVENDGVNVHLEDRSMAVFSSPPAENGHAETR